MLGERTRRFGLAILLALLVGIFTVLPLRGASAGPPSLDQAPAFSLRLLDGKVLTAKALHGHPVVLRFLASW